eukprot:8905188-Pyramimonas_sp.AAC.1
MTIFRGGAENLLPAMIAATVPVSLETGSPAISRLVVAKYKRATASAPVLKFNCFPAPHSTWRLTFPKAFTRSKTAMIVACISSLWSSASSISWLSSTAHAASSAALP